MADKKPISQAQNRAVMKYVKNNYYCPHLYIYKEYKDKIKQRAKDNGMTISEYINTLIKNDLDS